MTSQTTDLSIDQSKATEMLGKVVLVGVSYCDASGEVVDNQQYFGTVLRINAQEGLVIASGENGEEITLPPMLERYAAAAPGIYNLKSGHSVENPDYLSTWRVHPPQ
jgi:hypothetical protein